MTASPRGFDPDAALATLSEALTARRKRVESEIVDARAACIPIHSISANVARKLRPLAGLRVAAIGIPIVDGGRPALATLHRRGAAIEYAGISYGPSVTALHEALDWTRTAVGHRSGNYRPALLQSISLQLTLLLLRPAKGRTLFVPLLQRRVFAREEFVLRSGLAAFLHEVARTR
jgi:hypothetical protein